MATDASFLLAASAFWHHLRGYSEPSLLVLVDSSSAVVGATGARNMTRNPQSWLASSDLNTM